MASSAVFRRVSTTDSNGVPTEFRWVSVQMGVATWLATITLSMVGLGVWNVGTKIAELSNAVRSIVANDMRQDEKNQEQDTQIRTLETSLAKQQGYLEQILEAVRSGERRMTR